MAVKLKQKKQRQVDTDSVSIKTNIATMINQSSEISENWNIKGNTKKIQLYKSLIKGSGSFFFEAKWSTAIDTLFRLLDMYFWFTASKYCKMFYHGLLPHLPIQSPSDGLQGCL